MSNAINYTSSINITGNLAISGTTTSFGDNMLVLNSNPKNSSDTGILLQRYSSDVTDSKNYSGIIYSEINDEFIFGYSIGDTRGNVVVNDLIPLRTRGLNSGDTNTIGNIFTTGGNIGIATTSPTSLLDVNGTSKFTSLIANEISTGNLRITGSVTSGDLLVSNVIVSGNLTVTGTTTTINMESTILEDNLIVINNGPAGLADGGILVKRYISGTTGSSNYAGVFYKESSDEFTFAVTDSDPGINQVVINEYLPIRAKSLTLETSGSLIANSAQLTNANVTTLTTGTASFTNLTTGNLRVSGLNVNYNSFTGSNNVISSSDVTGFSIGSSLNSFDSSLTVVVSLSGSTLYENFTLSGVRTASGWRLFVGQRGDSTGIRFTITSGGQLQYTSTNLANWISSEFRWYVYSI